MTDCATDPAIRLDENKFRDPDITADGKRRASVAFSRLETLWFNTGTLCNLTCNNCYIESSPTNDALVYLTAQEVGVYLDEIEIDMGEAAGLGDVARDAVGQQTDPLVIENPAQDSRAVAAIRGDILVGDGLEGFAVHDAIVIPVTARGAPCVL